MYKLFDLLFLELLLSFWYKVHNLFYVILIKNQVIFSIAIEVFITLIVTIYIEKILN